MKFIMLKLFGAIYAVSVESERINKEFVINEEDNEDSDDFYINTVFLGNTVKLINDNYLRRNIELIVTGRDTTGILVRSKHQQQRDYEDDIIEKVNIIVDKSLKSPLIVEINNDAELDSLKLYTELKLKAEDY